MSERRNVHLQAAWLLHHRPFRDSSQILDVLTRDHGRLAIVARGSRAARSRLRGLLRPFLPLSISWYSRGDMGTLTGAELNGAPISLGGEALMAGYYLNELIINLLHRHDPQPEMFSLYGAALRQLLSSKHVVQGLREFELDLLSLLGYAVVLDREGDTGGELQDNQHYEYRLDVGPVSVRERHDDMVFLGGELAAIGRREFADAGTLRCANRLLRRVIAYHLNGKELKSRKVLRDVRSTVGSKTILSGLGQAMSTAIHLGVNVDHVATLRQARGTDYPSPVEAALCAEQAGADSITVHLREDRRHIQDADLHALKQRMTTRMNLEMAVTDEMQAIACEVRPEDACLVPEKRAELTTEGGLDVAQQRSKVGDVCAALAEVGIRVSLFLDPDSVQLDAALDAGAPVVELHTGAYAEASGAAQEREFQRIVAAVRHARDLGLTVHAGHGLHYENVVRIAAITDIVELNIGHSIVARSVFDGFSEAVRRMRQLIDGARR